MFICHLMLFWPHVALNLHVLHPQQASFSYISNTSVDSTLLTIVGFKPKEESRDPYRCEMWASYYKSVSTRVPFGIFFAYSGKPFLGWHGTPVKRSLEASCSFIVEKRSGWTHPFQSHCKSEPITLLNNVPGHGHHVD